MEEYIMKDNSSVIQSYNFNTPETSPQGEHQVTKPLLLDEEARSKKVKKFLLGVLISITILNECYFNIKTVKHNLLI